MQHHITALIELLDDSSVLSSADIAPRYHVDWGGENACEPSVVLRPVDTDALRSALAYCNENKLGIVTQGGMTGLSGGATPLEGEIVLSMERFNGIIELDHQGMTMTVKAGTPLQVIQQAAADADLRFPLDLGARGSCHIGGNVATNAGGNQVVRFGSARSLVLGLEAVMADGTPIRAMNKMIKNNAGYDLKHLFICSEGPLGVMTELVLRLYPGSESRKTALCALSDFQATTTFLKNIMANLPGVTSFEVMWKSYVNAICEVSEQARQPFDQQYELYVLLEAEGCTDEQFEQALFQQMENNLVKDAVIANSVKDSDAFWTIRDGVADLMTTLAGFASFDVGLPISKMKEFIESTDQALEARFENIHNLPLGHIADGNLHFITWTDNPNDVSAIYDCVYDIVAKFGGTVTAEHGVGVSKRKYLHLCRTREEITLMKTLKKTMDPNGILNPGRILG